MRLFIDLDSRSFVESPQFPRTLSGLVLKRRDCVPVDVQFLRSGLVVPLSEGATGRLGLKADKDFNGPFIASDLNWTSSGSGETSTYRFELNLNTTQINALFGGVPAPASVAAMLEIEWQEGTLRTSSGTLAVSLENDVVRGDEGVADSGNPDYPLPGDLLLKSENLAGLSDPAAARANLQAAPALALGRFRLDPDNGFQLFNPDTNTWHALLIRGTAGAQTLEISAPIA